jgi:hypothetical protein
MKKIILQIIAGMISLWLGIFLLPGVEIETEQIKQVFLITAVIGIGIFAIRLLVEIAIFPIKFIVVNGLIFILMLLGLKLITNFLPELIIQPDSYMWLAGIITAINMLISLLKK